MTGQIGEFHKGALFLSELKSRLFREGFTLAIPEPDLGDDLWIAVLNEGDQQPRILRCQVKSVHSLKRRTRDYNEFTIRFTRSSESRFEQEFYYLVGIFDDALTLNKFHVACIPNKFFKKMHERGHLRVTGDESIMLDFFLNRTDGNPKYTLYAKYEPKPGMKNGSGPRADVSEFFLRDNASFRAAFEHCSAWNGELKFAPDSDNRGRSKRKPREPSDVGQSN